ncbi:unnamed protein product [Onchocerca flexuosa]|uniref:Uncharacterized protein n=1 Tax=Onchocerca flexuosa TaxID=387005 RepID=A0A183HP83_9BILA|nr:unnamed protein product [Onchocerca flexuosa]
MESERLEPLETLEKDYYLGERNGWYSDGEQRDSERFVIICLLLYHLILISVFILKFS